MNRQQRSKILQPFLSRHAGDLGQGMGHRRLIRDEQNLKGAGGFVLGEFLGPHIGQHGEDDQKIDDNQGVVGIEPEEGLS